MQEVSYRLSTRLSPGLHRKKKAPWPTLPLWIGLYEIKILKDVDGEAKEIVKFDFETKDFNPYDPHGICKNHCKKVYYPWIHGTCHWEEEDPWRYYYNESKLNEPVGIAKAWKVALRAATHQKGTTTIARSRKLA